MDRDFAATLRADADDLLARWAARYERSALRLPRAAPAEAHAALASALLTALADATAAPRRAAAGAPPPGASLQPGSRDVREVEKAAALAGSSLAASGGSGFDVAAVLTTVRDEVLDHASTAAADALRGLFEWLLVLAMEAFAAAGAAMARERSDEQLERGTPVVLVTPELPAVLLVGAPGPETLDAVFGRALLLVVRVGAPTLVVDVGGAAETCVHAVAAALARLTAQKRMERVALVIASASSTMEAALAALPAAPRGAPTFVDRFDAAVAYALERAGALLVRRRE